MLVITMVVYNCVVLVASLCLCALCTLFWRLSATDPRLVLYTDGRIKRKYW